MLLFHYFRTVKQQYVATIGFFDGVHIGHQHLVRQVTEAAQERGMRAMVITFDRHPRSVFSPDAVPPLLTTREEKVRLLKGCGVDEIQFLHFDDKMAALSAREFMRQVLHDELAVRTLVIGYDHHFGKPQFVPVERNNQADSQGSVEGKQELRLEGFADYQSYGQEIGMEVIHAVEVPGDMHISSSVVRKALMSGNLATANRALGRPYQWSGRVVHGYAIGHQLGFPTANLEAEDGAKLLPANGVYAIEVECDGAVYPAMLNIGTRPTLGGADISVEAHLLGYDGDLYGRRLVLRFLERIRSEQRFESEQALTRQLEADREKVYRLTGYNSQ